MSPFARTIALALAACAALYAVDSFLAATERAQSRVEAERLYGEGRNSMQRGQPDAASEKFRAALFIARDNRDYELALGESLVAANQLSDAGSALADLLERDADGGDANLAMARLAVKDGRQTEAVSFYHRAIYGQWRQNAAENRVKVRFELVDLLVAKQSPGGLLAELLPLEEEAPRDAATRMKIGRLFLAAGAAGRGAAVFRDVLREAPRDPDAWAGLADAEFARSNYRTALADYESAQRLRPGDAGVAHGAELCVQVLALDPSQRGLGLDEQYTRSLRLLSLVLESVAGCSVPQELVSQAARAVKQRVSGARESAAYEANLDIAVQLWQARRGACGAGTAAAPEFLALTMNRLAQ